MKISYNDRIEIKYAVQAFLTFIILFIIIMLPIILAVSTDDGNEKSYQYEYELINNLPHK